MYYYDQDLINYTQTIQLHFGGDACKIAWMTLKNYGNVFGYFHQPHEVMVITVGKAFDANYTFSISECLDAVNVIKLQVAILMIASKQETPEGGFTWEGILGVITEAFKTLDPRKEYKIESSFQRQPAVRFERVASSLRRILNEDPSLPLVWKTVKEINEAENERGQPIDTKEFVPYFPKPILILQEERTRKLPDQPAETVNSDTRDIPPIYPYLPKTNTTNAFGRIIKKIDRRIEAIYKARGYEAEAKNLHLGVEQIECFGFRGDTRAMPEVRKAHGLLAGVTRTDPGVEKFEKRGIEIDTALTLKTDRSEKPSKNRTTKDTGDKAYERPLIKQDIFHLGKYTKEKDFKGYVFVTKAVRNSRAIWLRGKLVDIRRLWSLLT